MSFSILLFLTFLHPYVFKISLVNSNYLDFVVDLLRAAVFVFQLCVRSISIHSNAGYVQVLISVLLVPFPICLCFSPHVFYWVDYSSHSIFL